MCSFLMIALFMKITWKGLGWKFLKLINHITCMCLDIQWKTVYHSPVKVVLPLKYAQWQLAQNQWIFITHSLLLESLISLFEPIYKNIYLTITKLEIYENRKILFYTFFFSLVIHWKFVLNFFFKAPITTLICTQNVRNMFSLIFAGLFILKQCIRYMTSTFSDEFFVYSTLE